MTARSAGKSDRQQRPRLPGDPGAPLPLEVAALEVGKQRVGLLDELRRLARLFRLDRRDRLPRSPVVLDELWLVLAQPKGELEIAVDEVQRWNRAACPWPTPTQRVASP
jgi:hypothetical protein